MKVFCAAIVKGILRGIYFFLKLFPTHPAKVTFLSRQSDEPSLDFLLLEGIYRNEDNYSVTDLGRVNSVIRTDSKGDEIREMYSYLDRVPDVYKRQVQRQAETAKGMDKKQGTSGLKVSINP